jgi:hypothetical protein
MGKGFMFLMFMWLMTCVAGSVSQGQMDMVSTTLMVDMSTTTSTITVHSTEGFPNSGILVIQSEHIAYASKTTTTFSGALAQPLIRGVAGTEAAEHAAGVHVTTVPGGMMNNAASYNMAVLTDVSGAVAFVALPLSFFLLIGSFLFLPLGFLGTELQFLTYIWAIFGIGWIVALVINMAGGRRV